MESNMFDYEEIKKGQFFGIKKYADSVYRGELTEQNKRRIWGHGLSKKQGL